MNSDWWHKSLLALTLALISLSAAWLAGLQYRSMDVIVKNQEERRRRDLDTALSRAASSFDFEISRAHMAFQLACIAPQQLSAILDAWNRTGPYPRVVKDVHWTETDRRRQIVEQIGPQQPEIRQEPLGFLLSAPVAPPVLPQPFLKPHPGFVASPKFHELFVALDQDYLIQNLLPALLRREPGFSESDYELRVTRVSDGKVLSGVEEPLTAFGAAAVSSTKLFRVRLACPAVLTGKGREAFKVAGHSNRIDPLVPLRAILTSRAEDCPETEFPAQAQSGFWSITAAPREGGSSSLSALERRGLFVTSAAALSLAGSLAMLVVLIRHSQRLARLQIEFVASVSHELRTPIGTIGVAADNLSSGIVRDREEVAHHGRVIQAESQRLAHLIEKVLSYARTLPERWRPSCEIVHVRDVVQEALRISATSLAAGGLEVQQFVPLDLPPVVGDLQALALCLQNLLDNCAKYAKSGGRVIIRAHSKSGGREVCVSVEDRGPGLAADERKHLFEPFVRGSQDKVNSLPGFGLGLNTAKQIVEAHRGTIGTFTPQGGRGAGFMICLPAAEERSLEIV